MIPLPMLPHDIISLHSLTYLWNLLWNQEEKRGFRETNVTVKITKSLHANICGFLVIKSLGLLSQPSSFLTSCTSKSKKSAPPLLVTSKEEEVCWLHSTITFPHTLSKRQHSPVDSPTTGIWDSQGQRQAALVRFLCG